MKKNHRAELEWPGKRDASGRRRDVDPASILSDFRVRERWPAGGLLASVPGRILFGDNLAAMAWMLSRGDKLGMIYLDPPFNAGRVFRARREAGDGEVKVDGYDDRWGGGEDSWHHWLWQRLVLARELLDDEGSLFLHVDQRVSADTRFLLDDVFGHDQFRNEIIWSYKSGGASSRHFGRKHDTIYFYSKTDDYFFAPQMEKSYNRGLKQYRFKCVEEFRDEVGWHTMVNRRDVWSIDMVGRTSRERVDYPTQKPVALLDAMMASTRGPVADFCAGSGVLGASALAAGRPWTCCDASPLSREVMRRRFSTAGAAFELLEAAPAPGDREDAAAFVAERGAGGAARVALVGATAREAQAFLLVDAATREVVASAFRGDGPIAGALVARGAVEAVAVMPDGTERRAVLGE